MEPIKLAKLFHELYERYAPIYGYKTKPETRSFNKNSKNGQLMIAVCTEILNRSPIAQQSKAGSAEIASPKPCPLYRENYIDLCPLGAGEETADGLMVCLNRQCKITVMASAI